MHYWLLKTEPDDYAYADLFAAGSDTWDGVRNRKAQNYIRQMKPGDLLFIYHTGKEKAITGVAEVVSLPFADPADPDFTAISVKALRRLQRPVTLREIKKLPQFADWELVRLPRLSVMPVTARHWQEILGLSSENAGESGKN